MYLDEPLINTCSMCELTGQPSSITQYKGNRQQFLNKLATESDLDAFLNNCKAIIYNCPCNTPSFVKRMKELGFKKVFNYTGNEYPMIYTYMTKITLKEKKEVAKNNKFKYSSIDKYFNSNYY